MYTIQREFLRRHLWIPSFDVILSEQECCLVVGRNTLTAHDHIDHVILRDPRQFATSIQFLAPMRYCI
jgi:hypothetical protein